MGSLSLLQGIFPTQGSNSDLPCCRQILLSAEPQGSLRILVWQSILSPVDLLDLGIELESPAL